MSETNGHSAIEIRLREISQLFNSLDPSPFLEKDLDSDAEDHIVGWARDVPAADRLTIVVHLPEAEAVRPNARELGGSLANYFAYRAEGASRELRELFRRGRWSLSVGLPVLLLCLIGSQLARSLAGEHPLARLIAESLIILGWVANWNPIELFLYKWGPIARQRDLYRRLAAADVKVIGY